VPSNQRCVTTHGTEPPCSPCRLARGLQARRVRRVSGCAALLIKAGSHALSAAHTSPRSSLPERRPALSRRLEAHPGRWPHSKYMAEPGLIPRSPAPPAVRQLCSQHAPCHLRQRGDQFFPPLAWPRPTRRIAPQRPSAKSSAAASSAAWWSAPKHHRSTRPALPKPAGVRVTPAALCGGVRLLWRLDPSAHALTPLRPFSLTLTHTHTLVESYSAAQPRSHRSG